MMRELIENSAFLGVVITIGSFELGRAIRKKWNFALFNPLLLAILFSIGVLLLFRIDYVERITGSRCTVQSQNQYRLRRSGLFQALVTFIEHSFHLTIRCTCQYDVSHLKCTI